MNKVFPALCSTSVRSTRQDATFWRCRPWCPRRVPKAWMANATVNAHAYQGLPMQQRTCHTRNVQEKEDAKTADKDDCSKAVKPVDDWSSETRDTSCEAVWRLVLATRTSEDTRSLGNLQADQTAELSKMLAQSSTEHRLTLESHQCVCQLLRETRRMQTEDGVKECVPTISPENPSCFHEKRTIGT